MLKDTNDVDTALLFLRWATKRLLYIFTGYLTHTYIGKFMYKNVT